MAVAENASLPLGPYATFRGQVVDSTSILIAYTRTADADLNGVVDDDDLTIIGATYAPGATNASWAAGDFDFNGFIDDDDVTLVGAFYDPIAAPHAPQPLSRRSNSTLTHGTLSVTNALTDVWTMFDDLATVPETSTYPDIVLNPDLGSSVLAGLKTSQAPADTDVLIDLLARSIASQRDTEPVIVADAPRSNRRRLRTTDSLWSNW